MKVNDQVYDKIISSQSASFILQFEKLSVPNLINLYLYTCEYDINFFSPDLFHQFNIVRPNHIAQAFTKRQAEYLAGRYCAALALNHLGITDFTVLTGQHRSPRWPEHVVGSITHTYSRAYAVAANHQHYQYIGIDYEKIIANKTAESIRSMIINADETELLARSYINFELGLTLLFSAKESLFKALYPHVGHYFDFSAASLISVSDKEQCFELQLNQTLNNKLIKGSRFKGRFYLKPSHILTLIAM